MKPLAKSPVVKRSVQINGHKTSVSLEEPFWKAVKEIADAERSTIQTLINRIDTNRTQGNLSSAVRLFVLAHYRERAKPIEAAEVFSSQASNSST